MYNNELRNKNLLKFFLTLNLLPHYLVKLEMLSVQLYNIWFTVCPKKVTPINVWLWQVQTCTRLHIIKRAQVLMYCDYCHQILYKSVVSFSWFSIFTKRCRKVQLPAALLACFLCAVTVLYVNVQHFSFNAICWYFISSLDIPSWFLLIQLWR